MSKECTGPAYCGACDEKDAEIAALKERAQKTADDDTEVRKALDMGRTHEPTDAAAARVRRERDEAQAAAERDIKALGRIDLMTRAPGSPPPLPLDLACVFQVEALCERIKTTEAACGAMRFNAKCIRRAHKNLWDAVSRGVYGSRSCVGDETLNIGGALEGEAMNEIKYTRTFGQAPALPTKPCPDCDGKGCRAVVVPYSNAWPEYVPCKRCGGTGRVLAT